MQESARLQTPTGVHTRAAIALPDADMPAKHTPKRLCMDLQTQQNTE